MTLYILSQITCDFINQNCIDLVGILDCAESRWSWGNPIGFRSI